MHHLSLLTKLGKMQKTGFRKLQAEEFDADRLEQLTREGRVFIAGNSGQSGNSGNSGQSGHTGFSGFPGEVLGYVQAIDHLASERWREGIGALWLKLVHSRQMASYLTMRYGAQAGRMNRYAVTALVYRLLLAGVYRRDVPMLSLHLLLEGTSRKNKFYTSMGKYPLSREQEAFLRTLLRG